MRHILTLAIVLACAAVRAEENPCIFSKLTVVSSKRQDFEYKQGGQPAGHSVLEIKAKSPVATVFIVTTNLPDITALQAHIAQTPTGADLAKLPGIQPILDRSKVTVR